MIVSQQLLLNSSKYFTRSALRYLGKETNYKDLLSSISRLSYLYQHEIGHGVRMAFLSRNCPSFIMTFFAMTNMRSLSIPINPDAPPEEIVKWLKESKATHLAVSSDLLTKAREILQSERITIPIIEMEKKHGGEYDTSFTPAPDQVPLETDAILLLKSSGITGKPKFVSFTHKQLIHAATAIKGHYHLLGTDRFHTNLGWYHPFSWIHGMLFPLMAGATLVIDHGLQAVEMLDFLVESRVTRLLGTPPYFLKLLITCKNEKRVLPGTKSITVGMGYLSSDLRKAFELIRVRVSHCYGQVENLWTIAMEEIKDAEGEPGQGYSRGFVGKGLPGLKYKVMDQNGDQIEGKEKRVGQLALSGPTIMQGYLDREKETKMTIRGTWLYTGDLVQLDGEADTLTLTFVGRKEDTIQINDAPVLFSQIDTAIRSNPMVQDGAAFSIKDMKDRPIIVCAIVKKAGVTLNEKQILDHCAATLPKELVPKAVAFTDLIPRDIGNNVNCSKLRSQFSGMMG